MGDDRTCTQCGTTFRYPKYLRQHKARKTPCAQILNSEDLAPEVLGDPELEKKKCRFCGRVFSSYTSMRRHVRTACKIVPNEKNGDEGMERLYEHTIRRQQAQIETQQAQVDQLAAQNTEILAMVRQLITAGPGTETGQGLRVDGVAIQNVNHGTVQVDNSVKQTTTTINAFGQEGLDHLTTEHIRQVLDEAKLLPALPQAASAAVLKTALLVYSDSDHPENLTCYLPNKKTNDALVHTSRSDGTTGWEIQPATLVLPGMALKSVDALFAKQPYEDAAEYVPLLKELSENEKCYTAGGELRPVLIRNKTLLRQALESSPPPQQVETL